MLTAIGVFYTTIDSSFPQHQRISTRLENKLANFRRVRRSQRGLQSESVVIPTTTPQENVFSNPLPWGSAKECKRSKLCRSKVSLEYRVPNWSQYTLTTASPGKLCTNETTAKAQVQHNSGFSTEKKKQPASYRTIHSCIVNNSSWLPAWTRLYARPTRPLQPQIESHDHTARYVAQVIDWHGNPNSNNIKCSPRSWQG